MSAALAPSPGTVRVAIVVGDGGGDQAYEVFDVVSVDTAGARVTGPLLLEVGEELTLRLTRGELRATVRGRVAAHQRAPGSDAAEVVAGTVSWVEFLDASDDVRKVVGGA